MFEKIFGKKTEMMDMVVYWKKDVLLDDMMEDLETLGRMMVKPEAFAKGNRIVTVKNSWINDTEYRIAELYVDKKIEKLIRNTKFKAVHFTKTSVN